MKTDEGTQELIKNGEPEVIDGKAAVIKRDLPLPVTPAPLDVRRPEQVIQLGRADAITELLAGAYKNASMLVLTDDQRAKLFQDFEEDKIEVRPHDGACYITHMHLRNRLTTVLGIGNVVEVIRSRMFNEDQQKVYVDMVLIIKGCVVGEGMGAGDYFAKNASHDLSQAQEAAESEALRRCCKKFGVGTQIWRPDFVRHWFKDNVKKITGKDWKDATGQYVKADNLTKTYWVRNDDPRFDGKGDKVPGAEADLHEEQPAIEPTTSPTAVKSALDKVKGTAAKPVAPKPAPVEQVIETDQEQSLTDANAHEWVERVFKDQPAEKLTAAAEGLVKLKKDEKLSVKKILSLELDQIAQFLTKVTS